MSEKTTRFKFDEGLSNATAWWDPGGGPYHTNFAEVTGPKGWIVMWRERMPSDGFPDYAGGGPEFMLYGRPEFKVIDKATYPERAVHDRGVKGFTTSRPHDVVLARKLDVAPGSRVTLGALAHGWSNHKDEDAVPGHEGCCGDPACSWGVGRGGHFVLLEDAPELNGIPWNDAVRNAQFSVGIDPTGGEDPFADSVVWGPVALIYNKFFAIPSVEATAESDAVTLFLRHKAIWPFRNNDAYWGEAVVKVVTGTEDGGEPEPSADWSYPVVDRGSRVGVHSIYSNDVAGFLEDLLEGGASFPVVKAVTDMGWIEEVKRLSPDTLTVGRFVWNGEGCQGVGSWSADEMRTHAELAIAEITGRIDAQPGLADAVDYWAPYNEADPNEPDGVTGYRALAELMKVTMDVAEEHGLKLALFSFNTGCPEWDEMETIVETGVFARMREGGHVLALHEGELDTHDPKAGWGDRIPGAPEVPGAGSMNFRYRYLYRLLEQRGEVVPLVVSEWYCGDEQAADVDTVVDALAWYDAEASKDYYVWGICPFTLGPSSQWTHTDYERFYPSIVECMIEVKDRRNALPPTDEGLPGPDLPSEWVINDRFEDQFTVLLPQSATEEERAVIGAAASVLKRDVTQSADRAFYGPPNRTVYAVNPHQWGDDPTLEEWAEENYPGAELVPIVTDSIYEAALQVLPPLDGDVAVAQTDMRWGGKEFGEGEGSLIKKYGCFLTGLAIVLRKTYGRAVTPDVLDRMLLNTRTAWYADNLLHWEGAAGLFPAFDDKIKDNAQFTAGALRELLEDGWEVVLRQPSPEHFVYLEAVEGEALRIIDTYDGKRKDKGAGDYRGIRAVHVRDPAAGSAPAGGGDEPTYSGVPVLVGLHDEAGGDWMVDNAIKGMCLVHGQVQRSPVTFDFRHLVDNGVLVLARVNWGYADGTGTIPPPGDASPWIDALLGTMDRSRGVWGWILGNELNNPAEWPGGHEDPSFIPSPAYYVGLYNMIGDATGARIGPFAIDPFNVVAGQFGQPADPKVWAEEVYAGIDGLNFVALHAKTQTNDPAECWSDAEFADPPLLGRHLHLKTVEDQLSWIPERFEGVPVFVTELNPQLQADGQMGWEPGNAEWVRQAMGYLDTQPVSAVAFYRYDLAGGGQEGFALTDKPRILEAIKGAA